jgi:hypothetical protein
MARPWHIHSTVGSVEDIVAAALREGREGKRGELPVLKQNIMLQTTNQMSGLE